MLAHGDIKDIYAKAQTYREVLDDLNNFINLEL